jgi:Asp-tRNA(Asn)/Glu-tRNA(Gln) amidotransferase C subunit
MKKSKPIDHIDEMLSKPTWSVRSLLPSSSLETPPEEEITPAKLHHLLRLSALPLPTSPEEEASMLKTLHSQLHFVRDIQKVDTEGVEPLVAIRDETEEGIREVTIGVEQLKEALAKEIVVGRNRRPRRRAGDVVDGRGVEDWDVLGTAGEIVGGPTGRFFVVRSGKGETGEKLEVRKAEEKVAEKADVDDIHGQSGDTKERVDDIH